MSRLTEKIKPDRSKIDAQNARDLKQWTKALGVSQDELIKAIEKVGNSAAAVRKELSTAKALKPEDFPLNADGKKIKKTDGTPIVEARDPAVAADVAERLNEDEARREEDKWSA